MSLRAHASSEMTENAVLADFPLPRSCAALLTAMIGEVCADATEEQSWAFFQAVGSRISALLPLDGIDDDDIVREMNGLWHAFGWGKVWLTFDDTGIDIFHEGMPASLEGDYEGLWMKAMPYVLEGAYDGWFHSLGAGHGMKTRVSRVAPGLVELRYEH